MRLRTVILAVLLLAGVAAAGWLILDLRGGRRDAQARPERDRAVPVLAAAAVTADVPVRLEGVGTVQGYNTVTVRAQVAGKLLAVGFKEGQEVKKGDVLARIDPVIYQAQLEEAEAKLAQDQAQLANAKTDLERYIRLARTDYTTKQQADTQRAMVAQLDAQTKADQAAIDNARAYVAYCTITSPIDGRTGLRQVDAGNIVQTGDAGGIVTVTQLQPIAVVFTLPQTDLAQVNKAAARGPLPADVAVGGDPTPQDQGVLEVIDNQVDQTTGTIRLKAVFPNAELQLWPGQFVNARLLVATRKGVTVVPSAAVQQGPKGTYVFIVRQGDAVLLRPVVVTQEDETRAVIGEGVRPGERVVTSGFARLTDGAKVKVAAAPPAGDPAAPGAAAPVAAAGAAAPSQ